MVSGLTVTVISLLSYSAMAGIVGDGGIGDVAIRFGYYRYQNEIMIATVIILILLVQLIQLTGIEQRVRLIKIKNLRWNKASEIFVIISFNNKEDIECD
ncbi:hypothetical protein ACI2OX_03485 [Bacillus sp. N9]